MQFGRIVVKLRYKSERPDERRCTAPPGLTLNIGSRNMPKADTEHTPIDPYEGWPIGALEPAINDLRANIGILGHLITARDDVQIDEWQKCEGDLVTAMMRIEDLWKQVWDQRKAEKRAHEAALRCAGSQESGAR